MSGWTPQDMPDLSGRNALVTGANSGIGYWTAVELARHGARVLMACRNATKAADALGRLRLEVPNAQAEIVPLDLSSLASVESATEDVARRVASLDILVNNAGIMAMPEGRTEDGFEQQLGTNHLGHFALTGRLLPLLLAADAPRVVTVSSFAHKIGRIHFDDLMFSNGYHRWRAYGASKLANLLFTSELDRRAAGRLTAAAAHPGYASTHLQQGQGQKYVERFMALGNRVFAQSDVQGAWPTLRAATDPDAQGNDYFGPGFLELRGHPVHTGRTRAARDAETARRLWDVSEELTKVSYPL